MRCFNDSTEESSKARLKISFNKVDNILISNFYVKDLDNTCVVEIESSGSEDFSVTWSITPSLYLDVNLTKLTKKSVDSFLSL